MRAITKMLLVLLLAGCTFKHKQAATEKKEQPNVVIIFFDDMGYSDLSCFGAEGYTTPNIDALAAGGIKCTNFYTSQPVCSASRASLLTGCYSNRIGIHQALMPHASIGLNKNETTIASMLKQKGYSTAMYGKWHLGDDVSFLPTHYGFDDFWGIPYSGDMWPHHPQQGTVFNFPTLPVYHNTAIVDSFIISQSQLTKQITEKSVAFIKQHKSSPFFLYVPHPQPHVPLFASEKFSGKSGKGLYADVMMELDWSVGEIVKALKEENVLDNTLLIVTSDNGPWITYGNHAGSAKPLREGKGSVWEGGVREPAIFHYPKKFKSGKSINQPLMTIDLLPTIAHYTQADLPALKIDGKDASALLEGKSNQSPQGAYFFYYNVNELQAMRYGKWKLVFPHNYRSVKDVNRGRDGQPGVNTTVPLTEMELYDLENDIEESKNVIAVNPGIAATIQAMANKMREELGDQLQNKKGRENREAGKL